MSTAMTEPLIQFPDGYDALCEFETPARGYLSNVLVSLEDGSRYQLCFYDPVRLEQDLQEEVKSGRGYFAELNLILLPEVTTENIRKAVHGLWHDGLFQHFKPR